MKKLRAIPPMIMTIIGIIMAILVVIIMKDFKGKELLLIPAYEFWCLVWIISTYKVYCQHQISYGNDKLIIKRKLKRMKDGRPIGKWEVQEDEIALEDIQSYGYLLMGNRVEYVPSTQYSIHFCICLNDGRKLSFNCADYTKAQIRELCSYIEEHTGIVRTDQKPSVWGTGEKIFIIVFMLILYTIIGVGFYLDFAGK